KESDYRKAHNLGGGAMGGVGLGDEFVLVNANISSMTNAITPGSTPDTTNSSSASSSAATCSETGSDAYRITGHLEDKMKAFTGRQIEISGFSQPDRDGESKRPEEVDVQAYRDYVAPTTAAVTTAPAVVAEERRDTVESPSPAPAPAPA